jgi:hypothetical protein
LDKTNTETISALMANSATIIFIKPARQAPSSLEEKAFAKTPLIDRRRLNQESF